MERAVKDMQSCELPKLHVEIYHVSSRVDVYGQIQGSSSNKEDFIHLFVVDQFHQTSLLNAWTNLTRAKAKAFVLHIIPLYSTFCLIVTKFPKFSKRENSSKYYPLRCDMRNFQLKSLTVVTI